MRVGAADRMMQSGGWLERDSCAVARAQEFRDMLDRWDHITAGANLRAETASRKLRNQRVVGDLDERAIARRVEILHLVDAENRQREVARHFIDAVFRDDERPEGERVFAVAIVRIVAYRVVHRQRGRRKESRVIDEMIEENV